jgi:serine protease
MRFSRSLLSVVLAFVSVALATGSASAGSINQDRMISYMRPHVGAATGPGGSGPLTYLGGPIGVETAPHLYIDFWGSQWNGNDPSGEAAILKAFFGGVGGSSWNSSVTQYCQGVAPGTVYCNGAGSPAGNQAGVLISTWNHNTTAAPHHPTQTALGNEAIRAAAHFGQTTATANQNDQYFIATSHSNSASGFGSHYCAWHSSVSSKYGTVSYTNLPYMTDAGASCGANFNGLSATAGITIVAGHEFAETETDPQPSTGWLDSSGEEIGDKCAWIQSGYNGAAAAVTLSTGSFPVQSLYSDATGGCVLSYP